MSQWPVGESFAGEELQKKKKGALSRQPLEGTEIPSFYTSVGLVTLNPKGTF